MVSYPYFIYAHGGIVIMSFDILSFFNALPGAYAQGLIWGIMAIGVYITYRILDYADLSVDGSFATGGAVAVMLIVADVNPYIAMICAFAAGMLAGLVTGIFNTAFGIPPILSGILTQIGLYSVNMRILGNKANQAVSANNYDLIVTLRDIRFANIVGIISCVIIIILLYWFFGTEMGHSIRATGCNPDMARAQGINTNMRKVLGLVISNGLVAIAGGLYAQYQGNADVNAGRGAIVIGLAAVIMGEVIFGKLFKNFALKLFAVVIGAVLYFVVQTLVLQLGLDTIDLKLFSALIVALFLAASYYKSRYKKKIPANK